MSRVVAERHQGKTLAAIAQSLNADAIPTAQGGRCWHVTTVRNLLLRAPN